MLDDRKPQTPVGLLERCLGWIRSARRHAPLASGVPGSEPHPVNALTAAGSRRPIVEHTRAGDVYRL